MKKFLTAAVVVFGLLSGAGWAVGATDDVRYERLAVFARAFHYIETSYHRSVEPSALVYGAIHGMVTVLDRHSRFIEPDELASLREEADTPPGGIGISVAAGAPGVRITAVRPGSPAAEAGIRVGDGLVEVDGMASELLGPVAVVERLRGKSGTFVRIRVRDRTTGQTSRRTLRRTPVARATVVSRALEGGVGYLGIRRFDPGTAAEVAAALVQLDTKRDAKGLVLDLRGNPGGVLDEAVRVADLWLRRGRIVSVVSRNRRAEVHKAHPKGTQPTYPIVMVVDGRTASAAEIVAAALRANDRASIVGTHTYGKGTVQTVIELQDGSALRLTVARYLTPKGHWLDGAGIRPDRVVAPGYTATGGDRQLTAAVQQLLYPP